MRSEYLRRSEGLVGKPASDETEKQPEENKSEDQDSTNPSQQTPKVVFSAQNI
jgi:hypothetical protein